MDFSVRSTTKELLDRDDIPFKDIEQNMKELEIINTFLGGHRISLAGLGKLIGNKKTITVCEIGCGGGDNLKAIERYCNKKNIAVQLIGIDINPNCVTVAGSKFKNGNAQFHISDYRLVNFGSGKPDIIFSSLFCHHFSDGDLVAQLQWMEQNCMIGFFINDLHRHPLAYYSIRWITQAFSKSYLVKNDAPLSVLRGFKSKELEKLLDRASLKNYWLQWKWAFRWLIIYCKKHEIGNKPHI